MATGLNIVAVLPRLLAVWCATYVDPPARPRPLGAVRGFSASVLDCLCGGKSRVEQASLFDVLLVALPGGFGLIAPAIALPRFSASTYASVVGRPAAEIRDRVAQRLKAGGRRGARATRCSKLLSPAQPACRVQVA
ncbi:hypothetical protein [Caballeronia arvi]|uniref:hypothetical protein n=1 Tax=Caballeronia arvi TaxID=1777135 RepID=UPI0007723275|nr:hypothetical protein [Caballeronia arvi]